MSWLRENHPVLGTFLGMLISLFVAAAYGAIFNPPDWAAALGGFSIGFIGTSIAFYYFNG